MSAFREFNALKDYPQGGPRVVGTRSIEHRIMASYRGRQFFDGERDCGYGGLKYDGRWESVAASMIEDYRLRECGRQPKILQVQCEYGFLLYEFRKQGCVAVGLESSAYARQRVPNDIRQDTSFPVHSNWNEIKGPFDLVIAIGAVYTLNLPDAMQCLRQIEHAGFNAFVTLAAYDTPEDYWLMREWSLLGTTILKRDEWREVMRHVGYTGDYWFVTAQSLNLISQAGSGVVTPAAGAARLHGSHPSAVTPHP